MIIFRLLITFNRAVVMGVLFCCSNSRSYWT